MYEKSVNPAKVQCDTARISENRYRLRFTGLSKNLHDCECRIKYTADSAAAWINGRCIMDDFYKNGKWQINLRRHDFPEEMEIELTPLRKDDAVYLEAWPVMVNGAVCRLDEVKMVSVVRERIIAA